MHGLSLAAVSRGYSSGCGTPASHCSDFSCCGAQALEQASFSSCCMWARRLQNIGSVVMAQRPRCPAACGILPDQGSNRHPLHCRADSQSLAHQGCPLIIILNFYLKSGWMASSHKLDLRCKENQGISPSTHARAEKSSLQRQYTWYLISDKADTQKQAGKRGEILKHFIFLV